MSAPLGPGAAANNYTLIYGKKGQGKTVLLRMLAMMRGDRGGSWTMIDRTGRNGDLPGARVVTTPAGWWSAVRAARRIGVPYRLVLQPRRGVAMDPLWAMIYEVGYQLLLIDEAEEYASAHRIDRELGELVSLGRNRQVDIASTVRTPPELHGRLRGNADVVISFCQPSRHYAETLNREFYHLPDPSIFMALPKFTYLRAAEGVVTRGVLPVPPEYW